LSFQSSTTLWKASTNPRSNNQTSKVRSVPAAQAELELSEMPPEAAMARKSRRVLGVRRR
jgi:hypothetical protein